MVIMSDSVRGRLDRGAVPPSLMDLLGRLVSAGYEAYCVGGSVRDMIMGRPVHDWDVTTSAHPEEVVRLFPKVIKTGIAHGTVTVILESESYEVTTYRIDVGCTDGRRPDGVEFTRNLEEDLKRRDFTMNAMAWNPLDGTFVDPHGGCSDIQTRIIRAVGDPVARLSEDGLRSLRGVRFAGTLGFALDPHLLDALRGTVDVFKQVSVERIWQEMGKLLVGSCVLPSLEILRESGMWAVFWPEAVLDSSPGLTELPDTVELRMAHLFRHNSSLFLPAGRALKLSKRIMERVTHLLRGYEPDFDPQMSRLDAMRLRSQLGLDTLSDLQHLAQVDGREGRSHLVETFLARIGRTPFVEAPISVKELPVNGKWIQDTFMLKPSRQIGVLLTHCLEGVWINPDLRSEEGCRQLIQDALERSS